MKRIESLLKIAGIKFEFETQKSVFTNVNLFQVVKTVKCKRGIRWVEIICVYKLRTVPLLI